MVTIKVRRGPKATIPTLNAGEFGLTTDTDELYIGDGAINHLVGATTIGNLGSGTLAELNAAVSDATLIDTTDARLSDSRTPTAHDLSGALHNSTTLADLNLKVSDATLTDDHTGLSNIGTNTHAQIDTYLSGNTYEPANRTVNLASGNSRATNQALIDAIGKYIPYGVSITVQFADGTYTDQYFEFSGFYGGGILKVYGNSADTGSSTKSVIIDSHTINFDTMKFTNIACEVQAYYIDAYANTTADTYRAWRFTNCTNWTRPYYCVGRGTGVSYGRCFDFTQCPLAICYSSYVGNALHGIYAVASKVTSNTVTDVGTICAYGISAISPGEIGKLSTQPTGSTANEYALGVTLRDHANNDDSWIAVSYAGAWAAFAGGNTASRYRKVDGIVHVEISMSTGTINTTAFTLPVGYRPLTGYVSRVIYSNSGACWIRIDTVGNVVPKSGGNTYILGGFSFIP